MKKKFYILLCSLFIFSFVQAQKGNNQFMIGLEVGNPIGSFDSFKVGVGVMAKILFGIAERGQVGITTGYTAFKRKGSTDAYKVKHSVVPLLVSYRHKLSLLYVEPQLGYGFYTTTIKTEVGGTDNKSTSSDGGFTWALGAGLQFSSIDLGLRYQAGYPGTTMSFIGFHAAYVFRGGRN